MFSAGTSHPWLCTWACNRSSCCSMVWVCAWRWVDTRTYIAMLIVHLLRLNRAGYLRRLAQQRPSQEILVGLIPPTLPVRDRFQLAANAPLTFHTFLHDGYFHRKGTPCHQRADRAGAEVAATRS